MQTKRVKIVLREGYRVECPSVDVLWECPHCNLTMGAPIEREFHEDDANHRCHVWSNICEHTALYDQLIIRGADAFMSWGTAKKSGWSLEQFLEWARPSRKVRSDLRMTEKHSILSALRHIKDLSERMLEIDDVYLVFENDRDTFMIFSDESSIGEVIEEQWRDGACERSPEDEASEFTIWHYIVAGRFHEEDYVPCMMTTPKPLVRKKLSLRAIETVQFVVG